MVCSWWILLLLIGFIFIVSYDPLKGTIHTKVLQGPQLPPEQDPLRWKPSNGMDDPIGAIFTI